MLPTLGQVSGANVNMAKNINKQSIQTQLSLLSLVGVIALTACNRMPNPFNSNSKAPTPRMESVMAQGQSAMKPAFGLNTSNLFSEKIRSDSGRLDRLENAVQGIRNEFDQISPSVNRLVAIEQDVQTLIAQLEAIAQGGAQTSPVATSQPVAIQKTASKAIPTAQKTAKKQAVSAPALDGAPAVYGIRIGEHTGKTRLVLDINAPATFAADVDNNEGLLTVAINGAKWTAQTDKAIKNSPFIASYHAENIGDDKGVILAIQLKQEARIAYKDSLKALSGNGSRIVIDLAN